MGSQCISLSQASDKSCLLESLSGLDELTYGRSLKPRTFSVMRVPLLSSLGVFPNPWTWREASEQAVRGVGPCGVGAPLLLTRMFGFMGGLQVPNVETPPPPWLCWRVWEHLGQVCTCQYGQVSPNHFAFSSPKTHWPGGNQGSKVLKILQSKQFKPLLPQTDGTRQRKGTTLTRLSCQTNGVITPTQKLL